MNIGFAAAVRAEEEVIKETLGMGTKRWDIPLLNPGDAAVKVQGFPKEMFIRGCAVAIKNSENRKIIVSIAKTFYKMGVDIPDMRSIGCGYNRNEEEIKQAIKDFGTSRVQFDLDNEDSEDIEDVECGNEADVIDF